MHRLIAHAGSVAYHGQPKYTAYRHEGNNSAWTTNHRLLTKGTLEVYLRAYRERTQWLSEIFPDHAADFRFFELSFMISMIEKINRLRISGCEEQCRVMTGELRANIREFAQSEYIKDFETEWIRKYVEVV